jgi:hypothetical protein
MSSQHGAVPPVVPAEVPAVAADSNTTTVTSDEAKEEAEKFGDPVSSSTTHEAMEVSTANTKKDDDANDSMDTSTTDAVGEEEKKVAHDVRSSEAKVLDKASPDESSTVDISSNPDKSGCAGVPDELSHEKSESAKISPTGKPSSPNAPSSTPALQGTSACGPSPPSASGTTDTEMETIIQYDARNIDFQGIGHLIFTIVQFTEQERWSPKARWIGPFPSEVISVGRSEYIKSDLVYEWLRYLHEDSIALERVDRIHVKMQFLSSDEANTFLLKVSKNPDTGLCNGLHLRQLRATDTEPIIPRSMLGLSESFPQQSRQDAAKFVTKQTTSKKTSPKPAPRVERLEQLSGQVITY